jgi:hypothetical protein
MSKLRVAILGAGKIGKYHVREFSSLGTDVVAILGSTRDSSSKTADELKKEFNVKVNPYYRLEELLERESLDIVSICTPPKLHENQIRLCLGEGLHVMCEKPFVQTFNSNYETARELFDLAEKRKKVLTVNTQLASIVNHLRAYEDLSNLKSLSIRMEPGEKGVDMIKDHLPHTNSVLIKLIPNGKAEDIEFLLKTDEATIVRFKYESEKGVCGVKYDFKFKVDRPRHIVFSLNGESFRREMSSDYKQVFVGDERSFEIEDPLKISIGRFLGAVGGYDTTLVDKGEILENISLTEQIISEYISQDIKTYKTKKT